MSETRMKSDAPVQSPARPDLAPDEPLEIVFAEDVDARRPEAPAVEGPPGKPPAVQTIPERGKDPAPNEGEAHAA